MFNRAKKNERKIVSRVMVTEQITIDILGKQENIIFGQVIQKYEDGVCEYGVFNNGMLVNGIRLYPIDYSGHIPNQRYEKGQFANEKLILGERSTVERQYGDFYRDVICVAGRVSMRFKYDSDYHQDMLDRIMIDDKVIFATHTQFMSTRNVVNEENLQMLYKYIPELRNKECASLKELSGNYLSRSSEFIKLVCDLALEKALNQKLKVESKNKNSGSKKTNEHAMRNGFLL